MSKIFNPKEIEIIDMCHNGDFKMIRHTNYDGSIQLDVFDLYKSDKEGICFVIEDGQIIHENNLKGCLNFVHKWL